MKVCLVPQCPKQFYIINQIPHLIYILLHTYLHYTKSHKESSDTIIYDKILHGIFHIHPRCVWVHICGRVTLKKYICFNIYWASWQIKIEEKLVHVFTWLLSQDSSYIYSACRICNNLFCILYMWSARLFGFCFIHFLTLCLL